MLRILPSFLMFGFLTFAACAASATPSQNAGPLTPVNAGYALNHGANMPAPKLKANELAPLCRVCTTGRACGDSCKTKKVA